MWQKEKKYNSIVCLATLLTIASTPMAATFSVSKIAFAQTASSSSFPLPKTIPSGTTVKIDGSSSMARINDSLKQSFEQQFSGTKVEVATNGTDAAVSALLDGKVDLAALGRGLTPAEQAKGLEQYRLRREKIAIVVGENNPFQGNLTDQQFAKIFRGEITDWSQVGGSKGKIRFIDLPTSSDTREAFRNYPVFKGSNFAPGSTATQLSEDSSVELVKQLGQDGIGYVIANQVSKVPGLRVLKLHNTLPSDSRYPFSQPLVYAYKKAPSAAVAGFLGFSNSDIGTKAQETARNAEAIAVAQGLSSAPVATPTAVATSPTTAETTPATATTTPTTEATGQANTQVITTPASTNDAASNTPVGTTGNTTTGDNQTLLPNGENAATSETGRAGFPWWLWLLPIVALGAGVLWWLAGGKRRKDEEILEVPPASSAIGGLPVATNPEVKIDSPVSDINNLVDSPVTGAALAGGAVVGTGLWSRLTADGDDTQNENIPPETEIAHGNIESSSDSEEPLAVVMPTSYSGLPSVPQVDIDGEVTAINEPIVDVELPVEKIAIDEPIVDVTPEHDSNWQRNLTLGGGAAAAGAGLWSKFARRDNGDESGEEETQLNPNTNVSESNYPSPEVPQPSVELPQIPAPEMTDVWSDGEEANQEDSNWLNKAGNLGGVALAGSAAAGAGLWSKFARRDNEDEPNDTISISEEANFTASENLTAMPEVADIPPVELAVPSVDVPEVADIPPVELTVPSVDVPEVADIPPVELAVPSVDVPEVADIPQVELTVPSVDVPEVAEPLPDVWSDSSENEPKTTSNWLNNITVAGAAGAAGVAAVGTGLWSQFAQNQGNEAIDEGMSNQEGIDTARDGIETFTVEETVPSEAPINLEIPTDTLVEDTIHLDASTLELVEDAISSETPINLETPTDALVEDTIHLDASTLELVEDAISSETPTNLETPTDALVEDTIHLDASTLELVEEAISSEPINLETPTDALFEPTEPVENLEVPTIENASPSDSNLVSGIGAAGGAVLAGGIASRDWWTPGNNDADTESSDVSLNTELSPEETSLEVIADISEIPEESIESIKSIDTPQYPDSQVPAAIQLDGELPNISETDFNAVAAEIPEVVMSPEEVDTLASTPESGINAATIAGGAAVAATGAALWSAMSSPSDNTASNVMQNTSDIAEASIVEPPSISSESIPHGDTPSNVALPSIPPVVATTNPVVSTVNSSESTISLNPRTPRWAYATWNVASNDREMLRTQGGSQLALRLYDVTNIDLSYQTPQLVQQYECEETIQKRFVAIPVSDRDYITEIGYLTSDDRWLMIARSPITRIFSRPHQEFWFEADAELIIHGATQPGSTVTVGGHEVKLKPDGTFHLRIPFTDELIDYVMTAVADNSENAKTIHMHFSQES
jgi:phosphate transport system substrate-binding protein